MKNGQLACLKQNRKIQSMVEKNRMTALGSYSTVVTSFNFAAYLRHCIENWQKQIGIVVARLSL